MNTLAQRVEAVRRFSRFYTRKIGLLSEAILDSPFSLTEARVLYELANAEGRNPTELATELALDPGYVSRVVKSFARRGLVTRERSTTDRRRISVRLTEEGRRAFDGINAGSRVQVEGLLAGVDESGQDRLVQAMRTIEQELEGADRPPTVTYRPHAPGDMGWVVECHGRLYHASHGWDDTFESDVAGIVRDFLAGYDPAWERSWIAEVDGRRAGAIALVRRSKTVGQLRLLIVEPWARGLGIGARLVSECVGHARHVGYRRMVLFTVAGLDSARRLYEVEGFRLVGETPEVVWGRPERSQKWELVL